MVNNFVRFMKKMITHLVKDKPEVFKIGVQITAICDLRAIALTMVSALRFVFSVGEIFIPLQSTNSVSLVWTCDV